MLLVTCNEVYIRLKHLANLTKSCQICQNRCTAVNISITVIIIVSASEKVKYLGTIMLLVTCNEVYIRLKQLGESDKILPNLPKSLHCSKHLHNNNTYCLCK